MYKCFCIFFFPLCFLFLSFSLYFPPSSHISTCYLFFILLCLTLFINLPRLSFLFYLPLSFTTLHCLSFPPLRSLSFPSRPSTLSPSPLPPSHSLIQILCNYFPFHWLVVVYLVLITSVLQVKCSHHHHHHHHYSLTQSVFATTFPSILLPPPPHLCNTVFPSSVPHNIATKEVNAITLL